MSYAAKELRLARRALRTAATHLHNASNLGTLSKFTRVGIQLRASSAALEADTLEGVITEANTDLSNARKDRGGK